MREEKEKIWAWLMPTGKIFKVVTNPEDGTINVYDSNGKLIRKDKGLSNTAINLIEENFLEIVATMIKEKAMKNENNLADEIGMYIR